MFTSFDVSTLFPWLSQCLSGENKSACTVGDTGDLGSIPGSGRPPEGGHGNPIQYFCLENPMDRGAWRATVQRSQRDGHNWSDLACLHIPTPSSHASFPKVVTIYKIFPVWGKPVYSHLCQHKVIHYCRHCSFSSLVVKCYVIISISISLTARQVRHLVIFALSCYAILNSKCEFVITTSALHFVN